MKTLGTVGRGWVAVCALAVACSGGEVTCGEGAEEVDGVCEVVNPSTGAGGATTTGGSAGDGGTAGGGTAGDGGTAGTDAGGTSGTDAGGTSGTDAGGTGGTDAGGTGGTDSGGASGTDSGGTSGTDAGGTSGTDAGGTSGTDAGGASGTDAGGASGTDAGGAGGTGGSTGGTGGSPDSLCGSRDMTGATVVEGVITEDTTWSGLIRVAGDVSITNGATLTIEPGSKILVGWHYGIDVGAEDSSATLLAAGTPEAPILFCGAAERTGYWRSLALHHNVNPDSLLKNVLVTDAGAEGNAALVLHTPALIQHVQVVGAEEAGVETSGFGEGSEDLRVTECAYAGRVIDQAGIQWPAKTDLNGNIDDIVELAVSEISTSVTFKNHGAAYLQTRNLSASSTTADPIVIKFEPGVYYRIPERVRVDFDAVVNARGTDDLPVRFTNTGTCQKRLSVWCPDICVGDNCYDGSGTVSFGSEETSSFEHTIFKEVFVELAGSAKFDEVTIDALTVEVPLSIDHGRVTSDSQGLRIGAFYADHPVIVVEGTCDAAALPADTHVATDILFEMFCDRFEADAVIRNEGAGYQFAGNVSIAPDAHVTLEAGVQMDFSVDANLHVEAGGALSIEGTASNPVVFDAGDSDPARWAGLRVESSDVAIDYAAISYAGGDEWQGVRAAITTTVPISVSNTLIAYSRGYGIAHSADDDTDYTTSNTFAASNALDDTVAF